MSSIVPFEGNKLKSVSSQFNARRADKRLSFKQELQHFETAIRNAESSSGQNKALQVVQSNPQSAYDTFLEAAGLGLSWHPRRGYCYPVPYGKNLTLTIGYQGLTHMVYRAGTIKDVQANVVCKNDPTFRRWTDETGRHIVHEEARSNRGPITHAYCIAHFTNGGYHIEVLEGEDIAAIEACAKQPALWKGNFRPEMVKKSAIRRGWKHWPKDDGGYLEHAMEVMDKFEPMEIGDEPELTITDEQAKELYLFLTNEGLPSEKADQWLKKLADINGLSDISNLPASRFEEIKTDLAGYINMWKNQGKDA